MVDCADDYIAAVKEHFSQKPGDDPPGPSSPGARPRRASLGPARSPSRPLGTLGHPLTTGAERGRRQSGAHPVFDERFAFGDAWTPGKRGGESPDPEVERCSTSSSEAGEDNSLTMAVPLPFVEEMAILSPRSQARRRTAMIVHSDAGEDAAPGSLSPVQTLSPVRKPSLSPSLSRSPSLPRQGSGGSISRRGSLPRRPSLSRSGSIHRQSPAPLKPLSLVPSPAKPVSPSAGAPLSLSPRGRRRTDIGIRFDAAEESPAKPVTPSAGPLLASSPRGRRRTDIGIRFDTADEFPLGKALSPTPPTATAKPGSPAARRLRSPHLEGGVLRPRSPMTRSPSPSPRPSPAASPRPFRSPGVHNAQVLGVVPTGQAGRGPEHHIADFEFGKQYFV